MTKLCIVLNSDYSSMCSDSSTEIEQDFETIRDTLVGYSFKPIYIDVKDKSERYIEKKISDDLGSLTGFTECHIVLNSHGTSAAKDLQDAGVKKVIELVSLQNIRINQISALICNAMAFETPEEKMEILRSTGRYNHIAEETNKKISVAKKTTMQITADKIMKINLCYVQSFAIRGPKRAYSPIGDKDLVQKILLGAEDPIIGDLNIELGPKKFDVDKIRSTIMCLRHNAGAGSDSSDYNEMTSLIGQITTEMQQEIAFHLPTAEDIPQAVIPLYKAISIETDERMPWQARFRTWAKKNKPSSEIRLRIVEDYIEATLALDSARRTVSSDLVDESSHADSPSFVLRSNPADSPSLLFPSNHAYSLSCFSGGGSASAEPEVSGENILSHHPWR